MIRELVESLAGDWHSKVMDASNDIEDLSDSIQVALADEGVVVAIDDVIELMEKIRESSQDKAQLIRGMLELIEE